jgi:preprotein translocase subunit SecD
MFSSIRSRLIFIGILVALCVWQLIPSKVTVRKMVDGRPVDTVETLWKPALGLDLQGGMHLALELDQSRTVSSDPSRDLDLALTVLRKRIDEFGVAEPLVQKLGNERIVVELPGVRDPARAKAVVQRTAALEFRITDETSALDNAIPRIDRVLRQLGVKTGPGRMDQPSAVTELLAGPLISSSGTLFMVWAVCAWPVFSSLICSALPWSAVSRMQPPVFPTASARRPTQVSTVATAFMAAARSPVWPTMSPLA